MKCIGYSCEYYHCYCDEGDDEELCLIYIGNGFPKECPVYKERKRLKGLLEEIEKVVKRIEGGL